MSDFYEFHEFQPDFPVIDQECRRAMVPTPVNENVLIEKIDELQQIVDDLNKKIDFIFGNQVLIGNQFVDSTGLIK